LASRAEKEGESREIREEWVGAREPQGGVAGSHGATGRHQQQEGVFSGRATGWRRDRENMVGTGQGNNLCK
jgi:hypothetical protein